MFWKLEISKKMFYILQISCVQVYKILINMISNHLYKAMIGRVKNIMELQVSTLHKTDIYK